MKDQVENLKKRDQCIGHPFRDEFLRKTLQNAAFGNYKFLRIAGKVGNNPVPEYLPAIKPCLVAVDESHCISQMGIRLQATLPADRQP